MECGDAVEFVFEGLDQMAQAVSLNDPKDQMLSTECIENSERLEVEE